jgi:cytochrome c556
MKITMTLSAMIIAAGSVTFAQGQSPLSSQGEAAAVVKARQQRFKALGAAFKVVRDELKTDSPDAAKIRAASADITQAAGAIDDWFPNGSGPDSGVKTDARPEVWTDPAGFFTAREAFVREANKWAQLGINTDVSAWKEGAASLGQSCKGCHDHYRVKKE